MNQSTQSMFCPTANVISPPVKPGPRKEHANCNNAVVMPSSPQNRGDTVILEKDVETGSTYLHLVMPAAALNFLNGVDGSSIFDFVKSSHSGQHQQSSHSNSGYGSEEFMTEADSETLHGGETYDNIFVELGCKVYEINKVYYTNNKHVQV